MVDNTDVRGLQEWGLVVIDMQNDFVDRPYKEKVGTFSRPGNKNTQVISHTKGKLPTHNSKKIIKGIVRLIKKFRKIDDTLVIGTRDYHPIDPEHCSFSVFGFIPGSLLKANPRFFKPLTPKPVAFANSANNCSLVVMPKNFSFVNVLPNNFKNVSICFFLLASLIFLDFKYSNNFFLFNV